MDVAGSVALVTGGASGLGFATALALRDSGARVVIADLASSNGADLAREHGLTWAPADVADEAAVRDAVAIAAALGDLRLVVNCAGIASPGRVVGRDGPHSLEAFERVVRVNLVGTFNVIRLAGAAMIEVAIAGEERGVIVSTASVAAFDGQIGQASYSASKAGVAAMTLPMAREFAAHRIRVMTIAPGLFETPMLAALPQNVRDSLAAQVPHPARLGDPAEFAALVLHIAANPLLNGETIRLDGAVRMGPR
ncbi:SDR family NAD(P)-dependent oxidoreductase [Marisediminicola sp. LYQ134]|uniref:SDR family NAD(P)-dependent oxidoreductase n=1 Tax=Marisediminicola sp. LYQ134 TaxID=3391061 RepID=UPI003983C0C2